MTARQTNAVDCAYFSLTVADRYLSQSPAPVNQHLMRQARDDVLLTIDGSSTSCCRSRIRVPKTSGSALSKVMMQTMLDRAKSEEGIDSFPSRALDLALADDQVDLEEGFSYSESCNSRSLSVSSSGSDDQDSSTALSIYSLDISAVSHLAEDALDALNTVSGADTVPGTSPALDPPLITTEHMMPCEPVSKEAAQARLAAQLDMREGMTISESLMLHGVSSTDSRAFAPLPAGACTKATLAALPPAPGTGHPVPYGPSDYPETGGDPISVSPHTPLLGSENPSEQGSDAVRFAGLTTSCGARLSSMKGGGTLRSDDAARTAPSTASRDSPTFASLCGSNHFTHIDELAPDASRAEVWQAQAEKDITEAIELAERKRNSLSRSLEFKLSVERDKCLLRKKAQEHAAGEWEESNSPPDHDTSDPYAHQLRRAGWHVVLSRGGVWDQDGPIVKSDRDSDTPVSSPGPYMGVHPTLMIASLEAFTSFYETQGVNMQHSPTATYMQDIYRRQVSDSPLLSEETLARDGTRRAMLDLETRTQASMAILLARSDRISLYLKKLRRTRRSSEPSGLDPGSNSAW